MSDPELSSKNPDLDKFELELLKDEYFFLQNTIEDYNKQIWVIKALGISGTGAIVLITLKQDQSFIALLGCAVPLFFWILESQWKHFQRGFYPRVAELENILVNEYHLRGPAIYSKWCYCFKRSTKARRYSYWRDGLLDPSVYISYVLAIGFLLLIYILSLTVLNL